MAHTAKTVIACSLHKTPTKAQTPVLAKRPRPELESIPQLCSIALVIQQKLIIIFDIKQYYI